VRQDTSEEEEEGDPEEGGQGKLDALGTLTDQEANEIYQKVSA
jgi:hypothetical protein